MSLFCCNSKTVGSVTINLCIRPLTKRIVKASQITNALDHLFSFFAGLLLMNEQLTDYSDSFNRVTVLLLILRQMALVYLQQTISLNISKHRHF